MLLRMHDALKLRHLGFHCLRTSFCATFNLGRVGLICRDHLSRHLLVRDQAVQVKAHFPSEQSQILLVLRDHCVFALHSVVSVAAAPVATIARSRTG